MPPPTHPGVLLIVFGLLAVLAGAFGPWTEDVVMNLAVFIGPAVTGAFSAIAMFCLAIYLFWGGQRWRDFMGGLVGVTTANVSLVFWDILHFSDDYPRQTVDPTIGWGLWLTAAGTLLALIGLGYLHLKPRAEDGVVEPHA